MLIQSFEYSAFIAANLVLISVLLTTITLISPHAGKYQSPCCVPNVLYLQQQQAAGEYR
jgi:hypothetical protein